MNLFFRTVLFRTAFPRSIPAALAIAFLCGQSGHPQSTISSTTYEISGTVLSSRTGLPIRDAEVTITRTKDGALVAQIATDAEGRFAIPQLSGDKYSLQAAHRGYISAFYDEHQNGSTAIVTGEGLVSTGLRFMLAPQAVIFGVITDDSGDPVPSARISLYRQSPQAGDGKAVHAGETGADELGNYEIAHLPPGSYFLSVNAAPWYAARRQPRNENRSSAPGKAADVQPRSPLDVAYPMTYYPDVADSSFAVPIVVSPGERIPINIALHPVPAIHVFMQVPTFGADHQLSMPQLRRDVFGFPDYIQATVSNVSNGEGPIATIELSGFAPGAYDVELTGPNGEPSRAASVDLNSDSAVDVSSAASLVDVSGKIAMAGGENPPSALVIALLPQQGQEQTAVSIESDGSFHMRSVRPGTYEVAVYAQGYPMTTSQLAANGTALRGHMLTVAGEPVTLTAVVAEGAATVNGFARLDGKPASGVFLELIPKSVAAGRAALQVNQSDSDGSFNFLRVLPGEYTLLAIQEGWMLDWTNRETMTPYLPKGLKIVVPPHSNEVNLKDSVEVQPK
jgi:5-hydroxyisourate hydrolase-like protein (transthyretin family)